MSRDRSGKKAPQAATSGLVETPASGRPPIGQIRVAFEDAVAMLETGIAQRDYAAANYGMARCNFQLAIYVDATVTGPAPADEQDELTALQDLKAKFESLVPLAPDGGKPSPTAEAAWLAKLAPATPKQAVDEEDSATQPTFELFEQDAHAGDGFDPEPGEIFEALAGPVYAEPEIAAVVLGPLGSYLRTRRGPTCSTQAATRSSRNSSIRSPISRTVRPSPQASPLVQSRAPVARSMTRSPGLIRARS